jgi:hypothetical protein
MAKEYSLKEAQSLIKSKGKKTGRFYVNFYGFTFTILCNQLLQPLLVKQKDFQELV